jgi:hypothetical protein
MDTLAEINVKGFADEYIDPSLDLFDEIEKLKKRKKCSYTGPLLPGTRYTGYCRLYWR